MDNRYYNGFDRNAIFDKIDRLDTELQEEQAKSDDERSRDREFELIYARMIAGLKLNTGIRLF